MTLSDTYGRFQQVYIKVHSRSSFEPPLEYNQDQIFDESRFIMTFLTILGVMETLSSFRLVLEEKTGKEMPESLRLEFLEKFLGNNFALSDAKDNTTGPLNRGDLYGRFTFVENTISNLLKRPKSQVSGK